MPGITLHEAKKRTQNQFATEVLEVTSETDEFYGLISFVPGATETYEYKRRKLPGKVPGRWRVPGEAITETDNPEVSRVLTQMREMTNRVEIGVYTSMFTGNMLGEDEEMFAVKEVMADMARDVASAAIMGRLMDTTTFVPGNNFPSNFLNPGVISPSGISPGPFYGYGMPPGALRFEFGTKRLFYRDPTGSKEGAGVSIVAGAGLYLLRGDNDAFWIIIDVANVPGGDCFTEINFSSTKKQPDGMYTLTDASMVIPAAGTNGDAMGYSIMDKLRSKMNKFGTRSECAYVMHSNQFNALKERGRNLGGAQIGEVNRGGLMYASYDGVPIVQSDYITGRPKGSTASCRPVFCVNLNPDRGFFGIVPGEGVGARALGFKLLGQPNGRQAQPVMGFMWKQCGSNADTNSDRDLVSWFGSFGLRAPEGIARADDIADQ